MSKKYPAIGNTRARDGWRKNPKAAPACIAVGCECKATHRVDIEVNWFRGDDEVCNACPQHKGDAAALLQGIEARHAAKVEGCSMSLLAMAGCSQAGAQEPQPTIQEQRLARAAALACEGLTPVFENGSWVCRKEIP